MLEGWVRVKSRRACHKHLYGKLGEIFGYNERWSYVIHKNIVRYGVSICGKDYELFEHELEAVIAPKERSCVLNGIREYKISKQVILDYIDRHSTIFTAEEKDKIAEEVGFRMESLEVDGCDCQEYNFIEERYTMACLQYIFDHGDNVNALLTEKDDCKIWDYLD